jgi:hypothetical protein
MPVLGNKATRTLTLPSTEKSEDKAIVTVKEKLLLRDLALIREGDNDLDSNINGLSTMIVDWNYTDESGQAVPITKDSLLELEVEDFSFLVSELMDAIENTHKGADDEEKKTSLPTLTPPTTIEVQT